MPKDAEELEPVQPCDLEEDAESCAGEPVADPWDLPDETPEEVLSAFNGPGERGVTTQPTGGE